MSPSPVAEGGTIPATPLADSDNFTGLLVSAASYAAITLDSTSSASAVTAAIEEATLDVAKKTNRTLKFGHYKERLYIYRNGFAYPSALPISQVVNPADSVPQGASVWVGYFTPLPEMPVFSGVIPPQTDVEYYGGFSDATVNPRLARLIAKVAWYYLNPSALKGVPGNAKSVSVGGVSASGPLSQIVARDLEIRRDVEALTRPQARAWQS